MRSNHCADVSQKAQWAIERSCQRAISADDWCRDYQSGAGTVGASRDVARLGYEQTDRRIACGCLIACTGRLLVCLFVHSRVVFRSHVVEVRGPGSSCRKTYRALTIADMRAIFASSAKNPLVDAQGSTVLTKSERAATLSSVRLRDDIRVFTMR